MLKGSAVIGQSGGPTVVINQSLVGYIEEAVEAEAIDRVLGARHGVQGMMEGNLVDLGGEPADVLEAVAGHDHCRNLLRLFQGRRLVGGRVRRRQKHTSN